MPVIQIPVSNVAVSGPGIITYLERVGARSTIRYADPSYLTSSCLESARSTIRPLPAGTDDVDVNFGPDISAAIAKETSPLARGEWIKFFDAFYAFSGNSESEWTKMKTEYQCMQKSTQNPVEVATVAVSKATLRQSGTYTFDTPDDDFWFTLLKDAGVVPKDLGRATDIPIDDWKRNVKDVDAVIDLTPPPADGPYNLTVWSGIHQLKTTNTEFNFLSTFNSFILRLDKRATTEGYDDFLQASYAQPDLLLAGGNLSPKVACKGLREWSMYLDNKYCSTNKFDPTIGRYDNGANNPDSAPPSSGGVNPTVIFVIVGVVLAAAGVSVLFILRQSGPRNRRRFVKMPEEQLGAVYKRLGSLHFTSSQEGKWAQKLVSSDSALALRSNIQKMAYSSGGLDTSKTVLYMGELEPWMDENYIKQLWYSLGENASVKMIRDKMTGVSQGYCFVDFGNHASALRQLTTMQGSLIPGTNRVFKLNWASGGGQRDNSGGEFSLFVGDLSQEVTDTILLATFQARYDSCRSAKVVTDPLTNMSRGYGFVRFANEMDQNRALTEMQGQYCGTRPMRIATATPKNKVAGATGAAQTTQNATQVAAPPAAMMHMGYGMGMGMGIGMGMMAPGPQYYGMPPMQGMPPQQQQPQQQPAHGQGHMQMGVPMSYSGVPGYSQYNDPNNTTVFVGGLNSSVNDDELRSNFAQFGEIVYTKIPPGKGCGFVQFSHRQSAEMAIAQMNNAVIGGSRVRLSWGKSQSAVKGPGFLGPIPHDAIQPDPVDSLNEAYISQNEDSLERNDVEASGWRGGNQQ
ncbi:hypothetical protein HDV05_003844, partial [Chytridiales sp. JEL 0842]